jgi:hypothetical protein
MSLLGHVKRSLIEHAKRSLNIALVRLMRLMSQHSNGSCRSYAARGWSLKHN